MGLIGLIDDYIKIFKKDKDGLKGKFKIKDITSTNPIAVGDEVVFEMEDEVENRTIITDLLPRRNYVNRISPANKRQHHIVCLFQTLLNASLVDQILLENFLLSNDD